MQSQDDYRTRKQSLIIRISILRVPVPRTRVESSKDVQYIGKLNVPKGQRASGIR